MPQLGGVAIAQIIAAAAATAASVHSIVNAPGEPQAPQIPEIPAPVAATPPPTPQAAKPVDVANLRRRNASPRGVSGTMLTGSGGVNPSSLLLGGNTLLGQ